MRTFTTRDGSPWTPKYLTEIDPKLCIGCGRCYKVCTMGVLKLMGLNDEGEFVDPFEDEDEVERKVMVIDNAGNCIGCSSCDTVCGTQAQKHEPLSA